MKRESSYMDTVYAWISFTRVLKLYFLLVAQLAYIAEAKANNITVSNVALTSRQILSPNGASNSVKIKFDLSWENSWRLDSATAPGNWDAAWVFVKFKVNNFAGSGANGSGTTITVNSTVGLRPGMFVYVNSGTGVFATDTKVETVLNSTQFVVSQAPSSTLSGATITGVAVWEHVNPAFSGHSSPSGTTLAMGLKSPENSFNATSNPVVGAFVYRSSAGMGTFSSSDIELLWPYTLQGVSDEDAVQFQVFAVEMVYVKEGAFIVDGQYSGDFSKDTIAAASISASKGLPVNLVGGGTVDSAGINALWPNGYKAFYGMKYELSQRQYVDFFNTLTTSQQASRRTLGGVLTGPLVYDASAFSRNGMEAVVAGNVATNLPAVAACNLDGDTNYNEAEDGGNIACNGINTLDLYAYLDWSGLRPMTELEFVKACRGNVLYNPVIGEFAWGNDSISAIVAVSNSGLPTESKDTLQKNVVALNGSGQLNGPARVGIAATSSTNRTQSGAGYFGMLDLSGNLFEKVIPLGNASGRAYSGNHGDGVVSISGDPNETNWLNIASVSGLVGGAFDSVTQELEVGYRGNLAGSYTIRRGFYGGRGIRTAP